MRIGPFGIPELLVIAGLIVLLFGAGSLPKLGRRLGQSIRKPFKQAKWMWASATATEADEFRAEEDYGRECAREMAAQFPGEVAAAKQNLTAAIGAKLAARVKDRKFTFRAIASPAVNAVALPGGFIFISEPLLDLCQGEKDEIAFILGHEMAHVTGGHAKSRWMTGALLNLVTARAAGAGQLLKKMLYEGYSRDQELEADREALRFIKAAGFDPNGGVRALNRLSKVSPAPAGLAEYFSSHPPIAERVRALSS